MRKFWQQRNLINILLIPLSWIYYLGFLLKFYIMQRPKKVSAQVICVGNAIISGTGKTPFAIFLGRQLKQKGSRVAFISGGYKAKLKGPISVDPKIHTYQDVGDEPLLLSEVAPTYICKDRYKAALMAVKEGAEVLIMDDGFQNNTLQKDISYLLIDSHYQIGNGLMLPAGPLRESIKHALRRAQEVVLIKYPFGVIPKYVTKIIEVVYQNNPHPQKEYFAFCGIGNPERFFLLLKEANYNLKMVKIFPDHHIYSQSDLAQLLYKAQQNNLSLITTEKDFIKLGDQYKNAVEVFKLSFIEAKYSSNSEKL